MITNPNTNTIITNTVSTNTDVISTAATNTANTATNNNTFATVIAVVNVIPGAVAAAAAISDIQLVVFVSENITSLIFKRFYSVRV